MNIKNNNKCALSFIQKSFSAIPHTKKGQKVVHPRAMLIFRIELNQKQVRDVLEIFCKRIAQIFCSVIHTQAIDFLSIRHCYLIFLIFFYTIFFDFYRE